MNFLYDKSSLAWVADALNLQKMRPPPLPPPPWNFCAKKIIGIHLKILQRNPNTLTPLRLMFRKLRRAGEHHRTADSSQ